MTTMGVAISVCSLFVARRPQGGLHKGGAFFPGGSRAAKPPRTNSPTRLFLTCCLLSPLGSRNPAVPCYRRAPVAVILSPAWPVPDLPQACARTANQQAGPFNPTRRHRVKVVAARPALNLPWPPPAPKTADLHLLGPHSISAGYLPFWLRPAFGSGSHGALGSPPRSPSRFERWRQGRLGKGADRLPLVRLVR